MVLNDQNHVGKSTTKQNKKTKTKQADSVDALKTKNKDKVIEKTKITKPKTSKQENSTTATLKKVNEVKEQSSLKEKTTTATLKKVNEVKEPSLKGKTTKTIKASKKCRLHERYIKEIIPYLQKEQGYKNVNEVPKLKKIVVNMRLGDIKDNSKSIKLALDELTAICGQKPVITKAKKSIANFKLREGQSVGAKVTLRNEIMYEFLDKLISVALPRVRDFRGISPKAFDGYGNYSLGIKEQLIYPEINYELIEKVRGFDICIVTSARTDKEAKALLSVMGMPFKAK